MGDVNPSAQGPLSHVFKSKIAEVADDSPKQDLMYQLTLRSHIEAKQECSSLESDREIGHELYKEFGAGKLDCVDFQSVPADEAQRAGHGFWGLDAARTAQEQTQARGPNADAENEDGELERRKRIFTLFLPNVGDHRCQAGQQSH